MPFAVEGTGLAVVPGDADLEPVAAEQLLRRPAHQAAQLGVAVGDGAVRVHVERGQVDVLEHVAEQPGGLGQLLLGPDARGRVADVGHVADDAALVVAARGERLGDMHDVAVGVQIALLGLHGARAALQRRQHLHPERQVVGMGQLVEVAAQQLGPRPAEDLAPGRVRLLPAPLTVEDHDPERRLVKCGRKVKSEQLQAGAARSGRARDRGRIRPAARLWLGGGSDLVVVGRHRPATSANPASSALPPMA